MEEQPLPGGNAGGAVLAGGTVRRPTGPWTPSVHALLRHLQARGFAGAPRVLGMDGQNREVLTYLPGETAGSSRPWPSRWRTSLRPWQPWDIIGHNDATPYNAVWRPLASGPDISARGDAGPGERLVGFVDWDFAAPCRGRPPVHPTGTRRRHRRPRPGDDRANRKRCGLRGHQLSPISDQQSPPPVECHTTTPGT